jgi:hypothetical protein
MDKVVAKNPKHLAQWELTFALDGDQLTLEMEGMSEIRKSGPPRCALFAVDQ